MIWLVVNLTLLKNMKVNWDDDIPNRWENKKCSKPPTRLSAEIMQRLQLYIMGKYYAYIMGTWWDFKVYWDFLGDINYITMYQIILM